MFIPNQLPRFAGRPEMTCPLPTKIGPVERGNGTCKAFREFYPPFCLFLTQKEFASHFLIGCCPHVQPNRKWNMEKHCMSIAVYVSSHSPRKLSISRKNNNDKPILQSYKLGECIMITKPFVHGQSFLKIIKYEDS